MMMLQSVVVAITSVSSSPFVPSFTVRVGLPSRAFGPSHLSLFLQFSFLLLFLFFPTPSPLSPFPTSLSHLPGNARADCVYVHRRRRRAAEVYGMANVRVVDASVVPVQLSALLSSPLYAVAAAPISDDWPQSDSGLHVLGRSWFGW